METVTDAGARPRFRAAALYTEAQVCRALAWTAEQQATVEGDQPTHGRRLRAPRHSWVRGSAAPHLPNM